MQSDASSSLYKHGQWIVLGTVFGAFIGLLVGKFAIGLISGLFVGIVVDSRKRRAAVASTGDSPADESRSGT